MNSLIPYTPVQLHAVRLGIVVHALKIIADFPDEKMSRYAKIIMAEDPSEVLDRMNGITRKLEELVSF